MKKGFVRVIVFVLALMLVSIPVAVAAEGYVQDIGSWSDPTTGEIFKFVNAKSNDSIRQNQSIIYVIHTSVQKDPKTGKWAPKTEMVRADAAQSVGIWNGFMQGGFSGFAQGVGITAGASLIRPSNTFNSAGQNNGQEQDAISISNSRSGGMGHREGQ